MLLEGNDLKKRGIDVVVGIISASNRPKTLEQVGGLEIIPAIEWEVKGETKHDLDLDEIFARNPEVVLVDLLAHKNRPSAKNATRLEDVQELIDNKISVITTINIYELAGVKEVAEHLTGLPIHVSNTVPEDTLSHADEVKLLDVTPEAILKRLQEGDLDEKHEQVKGHAHLFKRHNLAVLRELIPSLPGRGGRG